MMLAHDRQISKHEFTTRVVLIDDTHEPDHAGYGQQIGSRCEERGGMVTSNV